MQPPDLWLPEKYLGLLRELIIQYVPQAEVWAYGSRVNGGAHEGSDLDLVLRNPANLQEDVEGWMDFKEALQASIIPIIVDVHLWSHLPPAFHRNIESGYKSLTTPDNPVTFANSPPANRHIPPQ